MSIWKELCSSSADLSAVSYRCSMLGLLEMMLLSAWPGRGPSENAFKVAAKMDLNWMQIGVVQNGLPFDLVGFLAEVQHESA